MDSDDQEEFMSDDYEEADITTTQRKMKVIMMTLGKM